LDVIICPAGFKKRGNRGAKKILMVIKEEKGREMETMLMGGAEGKEEA
jgi:hypothetical protein